MRPRLYHYNGCVFIRNNNLIRKNNYNNNCLGKSFVGYEILKDESCNIDSSDDLIFCRNNFDEKKVYK